MNVKVSAPGVQSTLFQNVDDERWATYVAKRVFELLAKGHEVTLMRAVGPFTGEV